MSALHHTVRTVTPFHDRSRSSRLLKIALWLVGTAVVLVVCHLAGFGVLDWFESVWNTMTEISLPYIVAGLTFQTIQTTLTALAWYFILAAGYPDGGVRYRDILAAYAAGVAMNGFLPANIGTFASLLMYVALIRGSTFAGVLGATLVQKIFYTVHRHVRLPLSLHLGSRDVRPPARRSSTRHRLLVPLLIAGAVVLVVLLAKRFWSRIQGLWEKAKQGGAILASKRDYTLKVLLPSFGSWIAKLAVVGIFLAAYSIPGHVPHHHVGDRRQLAREYGLVHARRRRYHAGRQQRLPLERHLDRKRNRLLARPAAHRHRLERSLRVVLVVWVFGWTGGKQLVGTSYTGAKEKAAEQSAAHKARKIEKKAEKKARKPSGGTG